MGQYYPSWGTERGADDGTKNITSVTVCPYDRRQTRAARRCCGRGSIGNAVPAVCRGFHPRQRNFLVERQAPTGVGALARQVPFPVLGNLPVVAIDTPLVLKVVKPLWQRVPETASRVRGRIENILGWATVHHYRSGDNPARWQGHLKHALPTVVKGDHHAALPYAEVPAFLAKLRQQTSVPAKCLEFVILTAARLGEALGATWDEVDLDNRVWTVPASRMKVGKEHKVPLSAAAIAVLRELHAIRQSDYIFPGAHPGKAVGKNMPLRLLNEITGKGATVHGFRSSFRDWAAERTAFPREVAEMALAHAIPSAVEAAYRRGDLFDKRRKLMDAWAAYCAKVETDAGKVVALARARTPS